MPEWFIEIMLSSKGELDKKKRAGKRKQNRDGISAVSPLSLAPPGALEH